MLAWSIELSEYGITYAPHLTIKAQVLSDFVVKLASTAGHPSSATWQVFVDDSSNARGGGAGVVLDNGKGLVKKHSLGFNFPVSNNQAEYEACWVRLSTTKELKADSVVLCSDSLLLVSQVNGEFQAKEFVLQLYL